MDLFEIEEIKSSEFAQENLMQSADWYFGFLQRHDHWIRQYDHNHLRITRVIKSLRLLVSDEVADQFKSAILDFLDCNISVIGERSRAKPDLARPTSRPMSALSVTMSPAVLLASRSAGAKKPFLALSSLCSSWLVARCWPTDGHCQKSQRISGMPIWRTRWH